MQTGDISAKKAVLNASTDAFAVYRTIRAQYADNLAPIRHRFSTHTYQLFSTAISLVLFLVKEMPSDPAASKIRADVEMVAADLEYSQERRLSLPLAVHGSRILRHVLSLYDARGQEDDLVQVSLISSVYSVIGGKDRTRQYLERPRTITPSMDNQYDNYDPNDFTFPNTLEAWNSDASLFPLDEGLHGLLDLSFWEQFQ
ncbi:uncharacterized protein PFLUO_LOCUS7254 [Penicillium psychrofluorescens]|uniref:uncharacterized protein n=1 Tax=Penicillium psychrofluorescens TaxID=3158075 RepID=UPI003CCD0A27